MVMVGTQCYGAITYDNVATGTKDDASGDIDLTYSMTVNSGDNVLLVVGVASEGGGTVTHTGVTFNGDVMTQVGSTLAYVAGANHISYWYLLGPDEVTGNVVVSGTRTSGTCYVRSGAISLFGVSQEAPETSGANNGTSSNPTITITTITNNDWVVDCASHDSGTKSITADAPSTQRYEVTTNLRMGGSTQSTTTAGNITMDWTNGDFRPWGIIAAAFKPYTGAAGTIRQSSILTGTGRGMGEGAR